MLLAQLYLRLTGRETTRDCDEKVRRVANNFSSDKLEQRARKTPALAIQTKKVRDEPWSWFS